MQRWYVSDLMTREVVSVGADMDCKAVADLLVEHGISAVPVVDGQGRVLGVLGEDDLLARLEYADRLPRHPLAVRWSRGRAAARAGDMAGVLMTSPAVTVQPTDTVTRAARVMGAARVKQIPVVDADGRLVGIVTRQDLLHMYSRPDEGIRASVLDAVLTPLGVDPAALDVQVRDGVVTLAGALDRRSTAAVLVSLTEAVPGVTAVVDQLRYRVDDGNLDPRRPAGRDAVCQLSPDRGGTRVPEPGGPPAPHGAAA